MIPRLLVSLFFAGSSLGCLAQSNEFHRELNIPDHADVYVSTGSGSVRVTPAADGHLTIVGHVKAGWGRAGDPDDRIRRIVADPPIQQMGNTVRIGDLADRSLLNNISIDYEIRAPREVALNLRAGSGDLEVDGVGRFLAATSGSGSVRAHGLRGPAQMQSGSGDVTLDETAPGDVHAHTGSGSVHLHGVDGKVEAHTGSGDLDISGRLQGPGELSTGSGSIRLQLASGSKFDVSASTGSGAIHAQVPGLETSGEEDHRHLSGHVNAGGAPVRIHTGSGDIDISLQ